MNASYGEDEANLYRIEANEGINLDEVTLVSKLRAGSMLELIWQARAYPNNRYEVYFGARNVGTEIAKYPAIRFYETESFQLGRLGNLVDYGGPGSYTLVSEPHIKASLAKGVEQVIYPREAPFMAKYAVDWQRPLAFQSIYCRCEMLWDKGKTDETLDITEALFRSSGRIVG